MQPDSQPPPPVPPQTIPPKSVQQYIPNGQHFITLIKKHLIGLVYQYLWVIFGTISLFVIATLAAPGFVNDISGAGALAGILVIAVVVFILILLTNIYLHNSLVITDKETIQVLQRGVFQLKVSHLSHADVEDITAEQNGLLPTLFNYGTLHIETSGELKNFAFSYCPDPDRYARIVLEARQSFTESTAG